MRIAVERAGRRRTTGAGKSTLIKIVAGVHRRGSGELLLDGEPVDFSSTAESKAAGVAVIYQEPTLFPDLSVTSEPQSGRRAGSARAGTGQVTLRLGRSAPMSPIGLRTRRGWPPGVLQAERPTGPRGGSVDLA